MSTMSMNSFLRPSKLDKEVSNLLLGSTTGSTSTNTNANVTAGGVGGVAAAGKDQEEITSTSASTASTSTPGPGGDGHDKDSNDAPLGPDSDDKDTTAPITTTTPNPIIPNMPVEMSTNVPTGFIFGSNIREKVENVKVNADSDSKPTSSTTSSRNDKDKNSADAEDDQDQDDVQGSSSKSANDPDRDQLPQSSTICSPSTSAFSSTSTSFPVKRKWAETPVMTGEEDESNVLHTSCRLFTFSSTTSTWTERGRGSLRLNDRYTEEENGQHIHSRVIVRTKGSLRLMLNTPVWAGMVVEKVSDKSLKMTGMEEGAVRVFLVQSSPQDTETLYKALDYRVRALVALAASEAKYKTKDNENKAESRKSGNDHDDISTTNQEDTSTDCTDNSTPTPNEGQGPDSGSDEINGMTSQKKVKV